MRCGCSFEDHWLKNGLLYLNSPMYHCEDRCPHTVGDCFRNCRSLQPHERPCLSADYEVQYQFKGRMIRLGPHDTVGST